MALLTYISAITEALREEMQRDERVFIIGEDVGVEGGVSKATKGLYSEFGAARVIDSPLAEGMIVSASIGAALAGLKPVPEIHSSDFIAPAMGALTEAARLRYRSGGSQSCALTLRIPYGSVGSGLDHSQINTTSFAHEPGLVVVAPGTVADAKGMLKAAIRQDDPVVYLEHRKLYRSMKEDLSDDPDFVTDLFNAAIRRPGKDLTLVTYGWTLQLSLQAAEKMHAETGAEIEVIDLRVLNPLDEDTFLESLARTGHLLIVHEDHRTLGIGAEISAIAAERAFDCLDAPILRVTAPDVPAIPFSASLEELYLPSVDAIVAAATRLLQY